LPVVKVVLEGNRQRFKIVGKVTKTTITKLFVEMGQI